MSSARFAVIAADGRVTDVEIGSARERLLFRVMPLGGTGKLFFDDQAQYERWHDEQAYKRAMKKAMENREQGGRP